MKSGSLLSNEMTINAEKDSDFRLHREWCELNETNWSKDFNEIVQNFTAAYSQQSIWYDSAASAPGGGVSPPPITAPTPIAPVISP